MNKLLSILLCLFTILFIALIPVMWVQYEKLTGIDLSKDAMSFPVFMALFMLSSLLITGTIVFTVNSFSK